MPPKYFISSPPWGLDREWKEANRSFKIHIDRYRSELGSVFLSAQDVRNRLALISSLLHTLALETCRFCPGSCCQTASPWYDFRDLLFLHLNRLKIPRCQPVRGYLDTCCFLSPGGCTLPRIKRPWICTWYLCPTQTANLKVRKRPQFEMFIQTAAAIKKGREQMELAFIRVIS
jgi:hypothetical protein